MIHWWGLFYLLWTVACYFFVKQWFIRTQKIWCSPIIVVPVLSIGLIVSLQHHFTDYYHYTQYLVAMLGPMTVAFAIPVYRFRQFIRQHFKVLLFSSTTAMLMGLLSSWALASLFNLDPIIQNSLLARSISIPFALVLTEQLGGSISLMPLFTVITGLIGMLLGDLMLWSMHCKHPLASGAAWGNAAHAMGIAKARQKQAEQGVIASLSMIISGILMVLFAPLVVKWVHQLLQFFA